MQGALICPSPEDCKALRAVLADALLHEASGQRPRGFKAFFHGYRVSVSRSGLKQLSYSVSMNDRLLEQGSVTFDE